MKDLESKDLWIQARIDELMDDADFVETWEYQGSIISLRDYAGGVAEREHAEIESAMLDAQIDNLEPK